MENQINTSKLSRLEKIENNYGRKQCSGPEHNPPTHLSIPNGYKYIHVCPSCGFETELIPQQISWKTP